MMSAEMVREGVSEGKRRSFGCAQDDRSLGRCLERTGNGEGHSKRRSFGFAQDDRSLGGGSR